MTLDSQSTHTKVAGSTTNKIYAKERWFFSQFFKTLLVNCCLNLIIWGGVVASLPFFGPEIEHFLFPSVKQIQKIRIELDRAHAIQDAKSKELMNLTEQTQLEFATLTKSIQKLNTEVKLLRDEVNASKLGVTVPETSEITAQFNALLKQFAKGDSFEKELHALDPFVAGNKEVLLAVHDLTNLASQKTRPFEKLAADLIYIKEKLTANPKTFLDQEGLSWLDKLWKSAKDHVSFERADQVAPPPSNSSKRGHLIESIDTALKYIEEHQFDKAINTLKDANAKPTFEQWIKDAEIRLSVEKKIAALRQHLMPLLESKVK